ncbi:hypothetical protein BC940DRAFT_299767 [Gongronella butleri]|nr:hypothetical protein BC940DRAFT_299767 [Gongronella butleri]
MELPPQPQQQLQQQQQQQQQQPLRTSSTTSASTSTMTPAIPTSASSSANPTMTTAPVMATTATTATLSPNASPAPRPGMGANDQVINAMAYANDVLRDVATLLPAAANSSSAMTSTALDAPLASSTMPNSLHPSAFMATPLVTTAVDTGAARNALFVDQTLSEGFHADALNTFDLFSTLSAPTTASSTTCTSSPVASWHDHFSTTSSLASSLSSLSVDLSEEFAKSNWYQLGMDKDVPSIADAMPGMEYDDQGYKLKFAS